MTDHNTLIDYTEQLLPTDIAYALGNIESADGMRRSDLLDTQISLGVVPNAENLVADHLAESSAAFLNYAAHIIDFSNPNKPQLSQTNHADFSSWMHIAHKHFPQAANAVGKQIFEFVRDNFSYNDYCDNDAFGGKNPEQPGGLKDAVQDIARQSLDYVKTSPDIEDVKSFLESDLNKVVKYAFFEDADLRFRVVKHEFLETGNIKAIEDFLKEEIKGRWLSLFGLERSIEWVAQNCPEVLPPFETRYQGSTFAKEIKESAVKSLVGMDRREIHQQHLERYESEMLPEISTANYLAKLYFQNGDHQRAQDIIMSAVRKYPEDYEQQRHYGSAAETAAAIVADDQLVELVTACPKVGQPARARSILVRRLASSEIGAKELALRLATQEMPEFDTSLRESEPIRNLLVVYEQTGDKKVLDLANNLIKSLKEKSYYNPDILHEFAVRKYNAGLKYGDKQLADEALSEMESNHRSNDRYDKRQALELSMKNYIELNDLSSAEDCAKRLFTEIRYDERGDTRRDQRAMLGMIKTYVNAGQAGHAVNLVREHYLSGQQVDFYTIWAIEVLAGKEVIFAKLDGRDLDSYKAWHSR